MSGTESVDLLNDDQVVETWTMKRKRWGSFIFRTPVSDGKNFKVEFVDDVDELTNVKVDYLMIGSEKLQAEDQETNTGLWNTQTNLCDGQGGSGEWLQCSGYIDFGVPTAAAVLRSRPLKLRTSDISLALKSLGKSVVVTAKHKGLTGCSIVIFGDAVDSSVTESESSANAVSIAVLEQRGETRSTKTELKNDRSLRSSIEMTKGTLSAKYSCDQGTGTVARVVSLASLSETKKGLYDLEAVDSVRDWFVGLGS